MRALRLNSDSSAFIASSATAPERAGISTLDYVLVLAVILPLVAIVFPVGVRILRAVYSFFCVWLGWPFL